MLTASFYSFHKCLAHHTLLKVSYAPEDVVYPSTCQIHQWYSLHLILVTALTAHDIIFEQTPPSD